MVGLPGNRQIQIRNMTPGRGSNCSLLQPTSVIAGVYLSQLEWPAVSSAGIRTWDQPAACELIAPTAREGLNVVIFDRLHRSTPSPRALGLSFCNKCTALKYACFEPAICIPRGNRSSSEA